MVKRMTKNSGGSNGELRRQGQPRIPRPRTAHYTLWSARKTAQAMTWACLIWLRDSNRAKPLREPTLPIHSSVHSGDVGHLLAFRQVVLQPTTQCNLNCRYCYLPERQTGRRMAPEVAKAIAESLRNVPEKVTLTWHGGEPLLCGAEQFRALLEPFKELRVAGRIQHVIQTNGTLVTDEWCQLFKEEGIFVGVSLDGNEIQNGERVDWAGRPSFHRVIQGMQTLSRNNVEFSILAVVNPRNAGTPQQFYDFFASVGCKRLGINIEEKEGLNQGSAGVSDVLVRDFWEGLMAAWVANPVINIREFDRVLGWMQMVCDGTAVRRQLFGDLWPTVSADGDVVVLAPEFLSVPSAQRHEFIVGNVLRTPLHRRSRRRSARRIARS